MKLDFILLCWLIPLLSCMRTPPPTPPDPCPPDCPEPSYPLEILWESYFYPDTSGVLFDAKPVGYKNSLLVTGWDPDGEDIFHAFMFDKDDGKILHRFDFGPNLVSYINIYDHYLIATALDGVYVYDLDDYRLVKHIRGKFRADASLFGNHIYVTRLYGGLPFTDSSAVFNYEIPSMKGERILSITRYMDEHYTSLNDVSVEIIEGDTILYGTTDDYSPFRVFAYNTTKKSYIWKANIGENFAYFNAPVFDEERIYVTWNGSAYGFDKFTGEQLWKTQLGHFYRGVKPLLVEGKLYLKAQNDHLYCLEGKTGKIVWHNADTGGDPGSTIAHHEGYIIFVNTNFEVYDMKDGREVAVIREGPHGKIDLDNWEESRRLFSTLTYAIPYFDDERNAIYFPDNKRMYAFKLPEDWGDL